MANKRTKKVGSAGRFGSRYGVKIRKKVLKIEEKQKQAHTCPNCSKKTLKREAAGMYKCDSCSLTIAGGAYYPETMTGKVIKRMISQKEFMPEIKELLEIKLEKKEIKGKAENN